MENLKKHKLILDKIRNKFTITDEQYLEGYFVFDFGKNSVCHFKLKETPGWLYGIWLGTKQNGYKYKYKLIGEHEEFIDKFKPSRTYINVTNNTKRFIDIVSKIQENPKLYFVDSCTYGDALELQGEERVAFVEEKYNEFIKDIIQREKDGESDRQYAFNFFKKVLFNKFKEIEIIGVTDNNTEYSIVSPRYDIDVVILSDLPLEKLEKLDDEICTFVQNANYSNRKTYEYDFEYRYLYDGVKGIKDCTYKYYR